MLGEKKKSEFCPSQSLSATVDPAASTSPKIPAPSLPRRQGSSALDVGSSPSSPAHSFSPSYCPRDIALLPCTLHNAVIVFCTPLFYPIALACATRGAWSVWCVQGCQLHTRPPPGSSAGNTVPLFRTLGTKITKAPSSRNTFDANTAGTLRKLEVVSFAFTSCASGPRLCCLAAPPDRRILHRHRLSLPNTWYPRPGAIPLPSALLAFTRGHDSASHPVSFARL